ncbi:MAG TPA: hypothetical protein VFV70_12625 [Hyphomonadaceae bacterium]|nr:hypothetical protein [Hyphomonadaceae bacterium]
MAPLALAALAGCETFEETYLLQRESLIEGDGVSVYEDLEEDFFGSQWYQYTASNSNSFPVCVQVRLNSGASTSGHSMGSVMRVGPGETIDVGYVTLPAQFRFDTQVWNTQDDGSCGYPPR